MSRNRHTRRELNRTETDCGSQALYTVPSHLSFTKRLVAGLTDHLTDEGVVPRTEGVYIDEAVDIAAQGYTQGRRNVVAAALTPGTSLSFPDTYSYNYPDPDIEGVSPDWRSYSDPVPIDELEYVCFGGHEHSGPKNGDGQESTWTRGDAELVYGVGGFDDLPYPMKQYLATMERCGRSTFTPLSLATAHGAKNPLKTAAAVNILSHHASDLKRVENPAELPTYKRLAFTRAFDTFANAPDGVVETVSEAAGLFYKGCGSGGLERRPLGTALAHELPTADAITYE